MTPRPGAAEGRPGILGSIYLLFVCAGVIYLGIILFRSGTEILGGSLLTIVGVSAFLGGLSELLERRRSGARKGKGA